MKFTLKMLVSALIFFSVHVFSTGLQSVEIEQVNPVRATLVYEEESIQPGHPFWVITRLQLDEKWHGYWKNPGDSGMAPSISWSLPDGFSASDMHYPYPHKFTADSLIGFGYESEILLLTEITPPETLKDGETIDLAADISWLACSDMTCLPGDAKLNSTIDVKADTPKVNAKSTALFANARAQLPIEAENLVAQRKGGTIELTLPHRDPNISAQFFPEVDQSIDFHKELIIEAHPQLADHHVVRLQASEDTPSAQLKGVLVTQGKQGTEAFNVNIPIDYDAGVHALASSQNMEFEGGVGLAILFAFIGGIILNLMPCVLPVMSFKVLGFVKMAGQSRSLTLKHGIMFSLGVLISFWALAAVLLALQAYGRSVGWGFQLQEPLFVATLAAVLLIFGLSLFGVFELGTSIATRAGQAQTSATATATNSGLFASFMSGILATAVATPCTGPFLGSALGFAMTLPPMLSMLIFTSLGMGMALPYLLLAAYPKLLAFMPKPGPWMETFKEIMGFLMLATVLWLVWVFSAQTNYMAVVLLLAGFFMMAVGCWIFGKWGTPLKKRITRTISYVFTAAFFLVGANIVYTSTTPYIEAMGGGTATNYVEQAGLPGEVWEEFNPERVAELQKQGIPVFIDFTAKWCLICQTNHLSLSADKVAQTFKDKGIVKMKADWTKRDPVITEELRKFGRSGVPLYVLYNGDTPEILPQVLTPDVIMEYIDKDDVN